MQLRTLCDLDASVCVVELQLAAARPNRSVQGVSADATCGSDGQLRGNPAERSVRAQVITHALRDLNADGGK